MERVSLFELVVDSFRGPWRWLTWLVWAFGFALVVLAVVASMRMCEAKDLRRVVLWATTFLASIIGIVAVKVWYWLDLNRRLLERRLDRKPGA